MDLSEQVSKFPAGSLTLIGTGLALAFNAGFFGAVGFAFVSLFALQEHLTFSLVGAGFVITTLVTLAITSLTYNRLLFRFPGKGAYVGWPIFFLFLFAVLLSYIEYRNTGIEATIDVSIIAILAIFFIVLCDRELRASKNKAYEEALALTSLREGRIITIISISICISFFLGNLHGLDQMKAISAGASDEAVGPEGIRYTIVRLGSEYALVTVDGDSVIAIKTESLSQMTSRRYDSNLQLCWKGLSEAFRDRDIVALLRQSLHCPANSF